MGQVSLKSWGRSRKDITLSCAPTGFWADGGKVSKKNERPNTTGKTVPLSEPNPMNYAVLAGAATVVMSASVVFSVGMFGTSSLLASASAVSQSAPAVYAAGLAASTAAAGTLAHWWGRSATYSGERSSNEQSPRHKVAVEPLLSSQLDSDDSSRDEAPDVSLEDPLSLDNEPLPKLQRKRSYAETCHLRLAAQRRTASWITALVRGVNFVVNEEVCELRLRILKSRKAPELHISSSETKTVIPLMGLALRLNPDTPQMLRLAIAPEQEGDSLSNDAEELFDIDAGDSKSALELAVALKSARAGADFGAGVFLWGGRPADALSRPSPAE